MKNLKKIAQKTAVTALFPFIISTNFTAILDGVSVAPSFTDLSNRLVRYFRPALVEPEYRKIEVIATAYSSTVDQTNSDPFTTAANTPVRDGIIAANFLKFYSQIKIPEIYGDKIFTVEDRMNRRFTDAVPPRIDIWMTERYLAKQFGVKRTTIVILD